MPVYLLNEELIFPPVELTDSSGVLAIGGDLSIDRLILAYSSGIFPWFNENDPLMWWSPDPRFVLFPDKLHISKSMKKAIKKNLFVIKYDTAFREVMSSCRNMRVNKEGTWITNDMIKAYCGLHEQGLAHSVEAWQDDKLAGGLYGVSLGGCFFGESMFCAVENASKCCLIKLTGDLKKRGFLFIDSQVYTKHLESLGAINIPRFKYIDMLNEGLKMETLKGNWSVIL